VYLHYLLVFAIFSFLSLLEVKGFSRNVKNAFALLSVLTLVFFAGLRNAGVGQDDLAYVDIYNNIPHIGYWIIGDYSYNFLDVWMEPGYIIFGSILKVFSSSYIILFLGMSLLSVGLASRQYYKLSPYFFITVALFFVHTFLYRDLNQVRSAVAAAIGLYLIIPLANKQFFRAMLVVALSVSFHMASLSYLAVVFLSAFEVTKRRLLLLVSFGIALGAVGISSIIMAVLPNMGVITKKLNDYSVDGVVNTTSLFDITNVKNLTVFFFLIFLWEKLVYKVPYYKTLMLFLSFGVFWRLAFSDFGAIGGRIATFYSIVEVILIPCVLLAFKEKLIPTIIILSYASLILYLNLFVRTGRVGYELSFSIIGL